jgi:hypothetical protein
VFDIMVAFAVAIWKKIDLRSFLVVVGWVKICVWLKIQLKLLLNKKQFKGIWLKLLLKMLLIIKWLKKNM